MSLEQTPEVKVVPVVTEPRTQAEIEQGMEDRAKEYHKKFNELEATKNVSPETRKIVFPAAGDFGLGVVWTIAPYKP